MNHIEAVVKLIGHENSTISYHAIGVICNITSGEDNHTLFNVLDYLEKILISSTHKKIKKTASWGLSNILSGKSFILEEVFKHSIFKVIIDYYKTNDFEISYEIIIGLANSTQYATQEQMFFLLENKILDVFNFGLQHIQNTAMIDAILDGISHILTKFYENKKESGIIKQMSQIGIPKNLENLLGSPQKMIVPKIINILDVFESE